MTKKAAIVITLVALVSVGAWAADKEAPSGTATKGQAAITAARGTVWMQYDDNTSELGMLDITPNSVVGNRYQETAAWGTFYCQQLNLYFLANNSSFSVTYYAGVNTAGTALTSYNYVNVGATTATNTWWLIDGSTTPIDWIGNTASNWTGTAYLGAYNGSGENLGLDTSGAGPFQGFSTSSFTGSGYTPGAYHAMIRAEFAGDQVPVELMNFATE